MTEPWFSPDTATYFAMAGLLGLTALAAPLIIRGRHRRLVLWLWGLVIALGFALLAAGLLALADGQPSHVTLPLLVTGAAMSVFYGFSLLLVYRIYRQAERRRIAAYDL